MTSDERASGDGDDLERLYNRRFSGDELVDKQVLWTTLCQSFLDEYIDAGDTVLDLGAGRCEFINTVHAKRKIAVDPNPVTAVQAHSDVEVLPIFSTRSRADRRRGDRCRLHLELPRTRSRQGCAARHTSRVSSSIATERLDPRSHAERALSARSVLGLPRSPRAVDTRQPGRSAPAHGVPSRDGSFRASSRTRSRIRACPCAPSWSSCTSACRWPGRSSVGRCSWPLEKSDGSSGVRSLAAMDLRFTPEEDAFRKEVRAYLDDLLHGEFADDPGSGRPGRRARRSSTSAWPGSAASAPTAGPASGWPTEFGGRGLPLNQQVIYFEEYARAGGPGRLGHIGEGLIGPTLIHFGSPEQQAPVPARHPLGRGAVVPGLLRARRRLATWPTSRPEPCSPPMPSGGTSGCSTARRCGPRWPTGATGASCWPAPTATRPSTRASRSCSSAWTRRASRSARSCRSPARSEFNEVFFAGARTPADLVVGGVNKGGRSPWACSPTSGARRRSASSSPSSASSSEITELARANGRADRPRVPPAAGRRLEPARDHAVEQPAHAHPGRPARAQRRGLHLQALLGPPAPRPRRAVRRRARRRRATARPTTWPYELSPAQRLFLYTRADTIYGGSNQIQRNIIGERGLGLPPEPRPSRLTSPPACAIRPQETTVPAPARPTSTATACSRAARSSSPRRPAPASARRWPAGASRRARRS